MDETTLELSLTRLRDHVVFPVTPELVDDVMAQLDTAVPRPRKQWRRVAAVAAVVMVAVLLILPGPRRAVADLLGLGGVSVRSIDRLPTVEVATAFPGRETTVADAHEAVDFPLLLPTLSAEPDVIFLDSSVPGGLVTLGYGSGPGGYGLVITEMSGRLDGPLLEKVVGPDTNVVPLLVGTDDGFWIEGAPHLLLVLDRAGRDRVDPPRLVGTTLLFERNGVTVRIESAADLEDALEIAALLEPLEE